MIEEENTENESNFEIQVDPNLITGNFTNMSHVIHSKEEFFVDFLFVQKKPKPFGKMVTRMVLTPKHAKRLLHELQKSITNYEESFGIIEDEYSNSSRNFQENIQ